jgi:hypothetical protein
MRKVSIHILVIVMPSLIGMAKTAPGLARAATVEHLPSSFMQVPRVQTRSGIFEPQSFARHTDIQHHQQVHHTAQPQISMPVPFWPDSTFIDSAPTEPSSGGDEISPNPYVIVSPPQASSPQAQTPSQAAPDYSYVAGCRAIPNGYSCDFTHIGGTP